MNPIENPYVPGAGTQPPELAGREFILDDARTAIERLKIGRNTRSLILVGLRGVGKTVLLYRIKEMAEQSGLESLLVEAHEAKPLPALLIPPLRKILLQLDAHENISHKTKRGLRVLRSFLGKFKANIKAGDLLEVELGVEPELGAADSGDLESDLSDLLIAIAEAAQERKTQVCLLVDELQYLQERELGSLIMALHQVSQRNLPLLLVAAGLPLILGLSGRSKSYAERLFLFPPVGPLTEDAARSAIQSPAHAQGVAFTTGALNEIIEKTERYPYFLQQWAYESWNVAPSSPIDLDHVRKATSRAIGQLDDSFFRVRFDRLNKREKGLSLRNGNLGGAQQRSGEIADRLKVKVSALGPIRSSLIGKGMIYSPSYGDNAFTVPLFDGFLKRQLR